MITKVIITNLQQYKRALIECRRQRQHYENQSLLGPDNTEATTPYRALQVKLQEALWQAQVNER